MITVGVFTRGKSLVKPIENEIKLKKCITWKQLEQMEYKLLENVQDEDIEEVKKLKGNIYSIGAVSSNIRLISLYISDISEILEEKSAIQAEKARSIEKIRKTTEQKVELEKQVKSSATTITDLRDRIKDLKIENDKYKADIENKDKQIKILGDKLSAESRMRNEAETNLKRFKTALGEAGEQSTHELETQRANLTSKYTNEIDRINKVIQSKIEIIAQRDKKIAELEKTNEELGKTAIIPDIPFEYKGKAQILGFCGQGSYGVSDLTHCIYKFLSKQKNCLVIDLDFKGGNLGQYMKSENYHIEGMLRGGALNKEHLIRTTDGAVVDYIGGVLQNWTPYDIISLDWNKIFEGDKYDYIICDCGIYGGYNIQTKVCEMIMKNGKLFYVYVDDRNAGPEGVIKIKNFSNDNGIPFISQIFTGSSDLYTEPITKEIIQMYIVNRIVNGEI